ncbi:hypothetical protein LXL04_023355 [Taraxacum kok-saghyz]
MLVPMAAKEIAAAFSATEGYRCGRFPAADCGRREGAVVVVSLDQVHRSLPLIYNSAIYCSITYFDIVVVDKFNSEEYPGLELVMDDLLPKKSPLIVAKCLNHLNLVVVNNIPLFFNIRDGPYTPTLRLLHQYPTKFVLAGANIMCPGLTSLGGILDEEVGAETPVNYAASCTCKFVNGSILQHCEGISGLFDVGVTRVKHLLQLILGIILWVHPNDVIEKAIECASIAALTNCTLHQVMCICNDLHALALRQLSSGKVKGLQSSNADSLRVTCNKFNGKVVAWKKVRYNMF